MAHWETRAARFSFSWLRHEFLNLEKDTSIFFRSLGFSLKCIQGVTSPEHAVLMVLQCICSFTQAFFSHCTPPSNLHHQHLMVHLFCSFHRCCPCPAEVGRDWDIKLLLQERRLNCKTQGNLSAGSGRRRSAVTVPEGKVGRQERVLPIAPAGIRGNIKFKCKGANWLLVFVDLEGLV